MLEIVDSLIGPRRAFGTALARPFPREVQSRPQHQTHQLSRNVDAEAVPQVAPEFSGGCGGVLEEFETHGRLHREGDFLDTLRPNRWVHSHRFAPSTDGRCTDAKDVCSTPHAASECVNLENGCSIFDCVH
jgi:hypothetical protein